MTDAAQESLQPIPMAPDVQIGRLGRARRVCYKPRCRHMRHLSLSVTSCDVQPSASLVDSSSTRTGFRDQRTVSHSPRRLYSRRLSSRVTGRRFAQLNRTMCRLATTAEASTAYDVPTSHYEGILECPAPERGPAKHMSRLPRSHRREVAKC